MSEIKLTKSQENAIKTRNGARLVSAGAGSGKTFVLVQRVVDHIVSNDAELRDFLIITYTKAAASNLRYKIFEALKESLAESKDENTKKAIRRSLALSGKAQIGTIHSFCSRLIRQNAHELGISPAFRIADDTEAKAMIEGCLNTLLEEKYAEGSEAFLSLVESVGAGKDDRGLVSAIQESYNALLSQPKIKAWIEKQKEELKTEHHDAAETPWGRELMKSAETDAAFYCEVFREILSLIEGGDIDDAYGESLRQSYEDLKRLKAASETSFDAVVENLNVNFPRFKALRNPEDPELKDYVNKRRNSCKDAVKNLKKNLNEKSEKLLGDRRKTSEVLISLLDILSELHERYRAEKLRRGAITYNDLEQFSLELLLDDRGLKTPLSKRVSEEFKEILIDEYQDVNPVQEEIIKALSRDEKNLFFVGDIKQSIYGFRLAAPELFLRRFESYAELSDLNSKEGAKILLNENFRSRPEILNFANFVFKNLMREYLGGIDYDEQMSLKPGRICEEEGHLPEIMAIEIAKEEGKTKDKYAIEASIVARKIFGLAHGGEYIGEGEKKRPIRYGDICILLRSFKNSVNYYKAELQKLGIPYSGSDTAESFFESVEIKQICSVLRIIDNPLDEIALLSAMLSPLFGFNMDEIAALKAEKRRASLFDLIKEKAENDEKIRDFTEKLSFLRDFARDSTVYELLDYIMNDMDYLTVSRLRGGESAYGNLIQLISMAEDFEKTGFKGLRSFINKLDELKEKAEPPASAGREDSDCVKLMSVHKSKGLQFPVVFVSDLARGFNKGDNNSVLIHPELGLGADVVDAVRGIRYPDFAKKAIEMRKDREARSEYMRVLYVALTRASERLYLSFAGNKITEPGSSSYKALKNFGSKENPVQNSELLQKNSYADWLGFLLEEKDCKGIADFRVYSDDMSLPKTSKEDYEESKEIEQSVPETQGIISPEALKERFDFVYPYQSSRSLPAKLSVSDYAREMREEEDADSFEMVFDFSDDDFSGEPQDKNTALERGIVTHNFLGILDFNKTDSIEDLKQEAERLVAQNLLEPTALELIDFEKILNFFASPLGYRIKNAEEVLREQPFRVLLDAEKLYKDIENSDKILVQGRFDLILKEADGISVLDYKTDRVRGDKLKQRAKNYEPQLYIYGLAAEELFEEKVKEKLIYFLEAEELVKL